MMGVPQLPKAVTHVHSWTVCLVKFDKKTSVAVPQCTRSTTFKTQPQLWKKYWWQQVTETEVLKDGIPIPTPMFLYQDKWFVNPTNGAFSAVFTIDADNPSGLFTISRCFAVHVLKISLDRKETDRHKTILHGGYIHTAGDHNWKAPGIKDA